MPRRKESTFICAPVRVMMCILGRPREISFETLNTFILLFFNNGSHSFQKESNRWSSNSTTLQIKTATNQDQYYFNYLRFKYNPHQCSNRRMMLSQPFPVHTIIHAIEISWKNKKEKVLSCQCIAWPFQDICIFSKSRKESKRSATYNCIW